MSDIANTLSLEEMARRLPKAFGSREDSLLWQLQFYANHPRTRFDVTFYDREPILEVTLSKSWARNLCAAFTYDQGARRIQQLLGRVKFSDGSAAHWSAIWTINQMPDDLDVSGVDMAEAENVIGIGGETLREITRNTYRCQSRAEEDHFIARWIAS